MNKRIIELAETAAATKKYVSPVWQFYDHELEHFVRLIVEDCISIIEPTEEHRRDADWGYLGGSEGVELLDELTKKVKEHFGVKE